MSRSSTLTLVSDTSRLYSPFWLHRSTFSLTNSIIGRPWSIQELREKGWDDLHKLWWVCAKERNRLATTNIERTRLKAGYGEHEANEREKAVSNSEARQGILEIIMSKKPPLAFPRISLDCSPFTNHIFLLDSSHPARNQARSA